MDIIRELILKIIYILLAGLTVTGPADTPKEPVKDLPIIVQEETPPIADPTVTYGSDGHLYIPDADISVALQREDSTHTMQSICDMPNTACYVPYHPEDLFWTSLFDDSPMIADHTNQGFNAIKTLPIGSDLYIEYPDEPTKHYVLEYIDPNGTYIEQNIEYLGSTFPLEWPRYSDGSFVNKNHTDCITLYTCNQDNKHITIARFKLWDTEK